MDVEWLILADSAQVVGGKLYLMGGGWDKLTVNTGFPVEQRMAIAASFLVDWNETNRQHTITLELGTIDGAVLATVGGEIEVGRPAGTPAGQKQRAQLAAELTIKFEQPGSYVISASCDGERLRETVFNVIPGPLLGAMARMAGDHGAAA